MVTGTSEAGAALTLGVLEFVSERDGLVRSVRCAAQSVKGANVASATIAMIAHMMMTMNVIEERCCVARICMMFVFGRSFKFFSDVSDLVKDLQGLWIGALTESCGPR